jgi:hypothetical protein
MLGTICPDHAATSGAEALAIGAKCARAAAPHLDLADQYAAAAAPAGADPTLTMLYVVRFEAEPVRRNPRDESWAISGNSLLSPPTLPQREVRTVDG